MPYCTLDDMAALLPGATLIELTDDEGSGVVDEDIVSEAVMQADAEIDSYCGGRYGVPLSPAPELIRKLSADIAIYHLYSRRVAQMPELRKERYRGAVRMLENIARGLVTLGPDTAAQDIRHHEAETNKPTDTNTFSRGGLAGF